MSYSSFAGAWAKIKDHVTIYKWKNLKQLIFNFSIRYILLEKFSNINIFSAETGNFVGKND